MYASGPPIGQTSGHGDWRNPLNIPEDKNAPLDYTQRTGQTLIADGVPEVMKRAREVLRMGASQLKGMGGGGVNSLYDPLDVTEYTFEEAKALCDVAATWNTYVACGEAGIAILDLTDLLTYPRVNVIGDESRIHWNLGTLQFAPTTTGPWSDLPTASPFPLSPISDKGFFRVKVEP